MANGLEAILVKTGMRQILRLHAVLRDGYVLTED